MVGFVIIMLGWFDLMCLVALFFDLQVSCALSLSLSLSVVHPQFGIKSKKQTNQNPSILSFDQLLVARGSIKVGHIIMSNCTTKVDTMCHISNNKSIPY